MQPSGNHRALVYFSWKFFSETYKNICLSPFTPFSFFPYFLVNVSRVIFFSCFNSTAWGAVEWFSKMRTNLVVQNRYFFRWKTTKLCLWPPWKRSSMVPFVESFSTFARTKLLRWNRNTGVDIKIILFTEWKIIRREETGQHKVHERPVGSLAHAIVLVFAGARSISTPCSGSIST